MLAIDADCRCCHPLPRYNNWGVFQPGDSPEPNNQFGSEYCGVANWTELVTATGAWGWADTACKTQTISICKVLREWLQYRTVYGAGCCGGGE
jgi:hypothetical protein